MKWIHSKSTSDTPNSGNDSATSSAILLLNSRRSLIRRTRSIFIEEFLVTALIKFLISSSIPVKSLILSCEPILSAAFTGSFMFIQQTTSQMNFAKSLSLNGMFSIYNCLFLNGKMLRLCKSGT